MPREMRFCRACGFRLGEGVAEFTETVRFDKATPGKPRGTATSEAQNAATFAFPKLNSCGSINDWNALAKDFKTAIKSAASQIEQERLKHQQRKQQQPKQQPKKGQRHRSSWLGWIIALIIFSVLSSGSLTGLRGLRNGMRGSSSASSAARSWVGADDLKNSDKGLTFNKVEPEGSPLDKAGLVGGDLIASFDGQPVKNSSELTKLLAATPIGKTVEVVYIRDGETKTTKLTTVSKDEMERLEEVADNKAQGYVGIGGSSKQVAIPGTNISGVQLNSIRRNNPAYIAGMRDGDIVIEFDGVPIRTYDELESRTRRAVPDSMVKVVVMRGAERLEIQVKVGVDD
jgi:predicted metalloprotease with PDZ domain